MQIYLVGGAVRDKLLGQPVQEKDWVVVGATLQTMLQLGYRQVGKDFPVFLHPETHEEYALARTERKVGRGYTGFTFDTSPQVTLIEDLQRRDLTINAIAETLDGQLIDPYHGQKDLAQKILRHVSPAFVEDPVRILRIARFAARFSELGFKIAPETLQLMQTMVQAGEVDALVAERVWKEWERALGEKTPAQFFQVLADVGALAVLFPALQNDLAARLVRLQHAAQATTDVMVRFAVLLQDCAVAEITTLCARYRVPTEYRELAVLLAKNIEPYNQMAKLTPTQIADLLQALDAYRREPRFIKFLTAGRVSFPAAAQLLQTCFAAAKSVDTQKIARELTGKAIGERVHAERINKLTEIIKNGSP